MIDVDVWADVRCPWCWVELRRLRRAIGMIDEPVRVRRRSFLLEPLGPVSPGRPTSHVAISEWGMSQAQWDARSRLIRSAGSGEGLRINVDTALMFDSRPVHGLLKLAAEVSDDVDAVWEAAFVAHFERNEDLGDPAVLRALAAGAGLGDAEVRRALTGDLFRAEVASDVARARRMSITSIPTVASSSGRRVSGNASAADLARFLAATGSDR